MLPTFLGIGVPRGGSTWLYELLASHPDVYVPPHRKEVHFFDRYYDRGLQWYQGFFPSDAQAGRFLAIGEVTPTYLYCSECPRRIVDVSSITKLIVILRDPVDRAYSYYWHMVRNKNLAESFEGFLESSQYAIQRGFYSPPLKDYLCYFRRNQILALIHEQVVTDVSEAKKTLAGFLGVSLDRFPDRITTQKVNRSYIPRFRSGYALAARSAWFLRGLSLDRFVGVAKRLGVKRLFGEGDPKPPMEADTRKYLRELYRDEVNELEQLMQIDLKYWK